MSKKPKRPNYNLTINACFTGYVVQAIINNFIPLLFLTFQSSYHIPLSQITILVTFNFGVQLLVDVLSMTFIDKIGYRLSMLIAHGFAVAGLVSLTFLPEMFSEPFIGILLSVMIYAVGGGILEVLVSPVMESCPTANKEKAMSLLHSFYCWGHVGVVIFSTLFFRFFGIQNWKIMALIWAMVPFVNAIIFTKAPIAPLIAEGEKAETIGGLFRRKIFWLFIVMMVCAGASEQAVSQWASTFAEKGLGVTKTIGDLAGPMSFAILMGTARAFYGKFGERINLNKFMIYSSILCVFSYLTIVFVPHPAISLVACAVTGFSVGIMWPGTFSKAAAGIRGGGTYMFAMLAVAGDIGCAGGPTVVGFVSSRFDDDLRIGIFAAVVFPVVLLVCLLGRRKVPKRKGNQV